jgi:hypothetical protein
MPSQRITMRKIKEVLRLRLTCNLSLDAIARALSLSKGVVAKYVKGAEQANLQWGEACALDEAFPSKFKTECIGLPHLKRRGLRLRFCNHRRRAVIEGVGREGFYQVCGTGRP